MPNSAAPFYVIATTFLLLLIKQR